MNLWEDFADGPRRSRSTLGSARPPPSCSASTPSACGTTRRCTSRPAAARPTPTRTTRTGRSRRPQSITAWIPFEGSTLESGAMAYLPGTHTDRPAQVRQHLLRRARGHPRRPRGRRHRAGLRRGAEGLGGVPPRPDRPPRRTPTRPTATAPCTRSSTSPTAAPAATRSRTSPSTAAASRSARRSTASHADRLAPSRRRPAPGAGDAVRARLADHQHRRRPAVVTATDSRFGPPPASDFEVAPTDDEVASFRENGFLVVERITTDEEIDWLRPIFEAAFDESDGKMAPQAKKAELSRRCSRSSASRSCSHTTYLRNATALRGRAARRRRVEIDDVGPHDPQARRRQPGGAVAPGPGVLGARARLPRPRVVAAAARRHRRDGGDAVHPRLAQARRPRPRLLRRRRRAQPARGRAAST